MRAKISRKESKESIYWLKIINLPSGIIPYLNLDTVENKIKNHP